MKVYVLETGYQYDGGSVDSVFMSKKEAFKEAQRQFEGEKKHWIDEKAKYPNMLEFTECKEFRPLQKWDKYNLKWIWWVNNQYFSVKEMETNEKESSLLSDSDKKVET